MLQADSEILMKYIIVGERNVGKSTLVQKYATGKYHEKLKATLGCDFALKTLSLNDFTVTLQLWDISGHERYGCLTRVFYHNAAAGFVCYDRSNPTSLQTAVLWKQDIDNKVFDDEGHRIPVFLLELKTDIEEVHGAKPSDDELHEFCKLHSFEGFYRVSSKTKLNVNECFGDMVSLCLKRYNAATATQPQNIPPPKRSSKEKLKKLTARDVARIGIGDESPVIQLQISKQRKSTCC